ncbi:hypothetical protein M9M90_01170 [Phenylobacterium sp. LH3H17]|uniref:hypothetical protein n=1 Tax=Phenylobacterium sp. LH3H17 TaxID=2903901 RepID=UPI0020C9EF66|nr:hypothetical protein [Phenylobacterium sp. LH3H17]UTP39815.1 hypothetical protein M9M90_01170 [Phenylobacterium sp. LH3H17]
MIVVVISTVLTQINSAGSSKDTADAIERVADVAEAAQAQADAMKAQIAEMRTQTGALEKQATAGRDQARALDEANNNNRTTMMLNARPNVSIKRLEFLEVPSPDGGDLEFTLTPVWLNSGSTQTKNLFNNTECFHTDRPMLEMKTVRGLPRGAIRNIIGPRADAQIGSCTVSGKLMNSLKLGKRYLYFRARLDYTDAFDNEQYRTEMCAEIRPKPGDYTTRGQNLGMDAVTCGRFNCQDGDCEP